MEIEERTAIAESPFGVLPDEVILVLLDLMTPAPDLNPLVGRRSIRPLLNFSLTCKHFRRIALDTRLPLHRAQRGHQLLNRRFAVDEGDPDDTATGLLTQWRHTLEPIRHGAHLNTDRVGFVGAATVLAVFVNGRPVPMSMLDAGFAELFESGDVHGLCDAFERKVEAAVSAYTVAMESANAVKAQYRSMTGPEVEKAMVESLIDQDESVIAARALTPISVFMQLLLQNGSGYRPSPAECFGYLPEVIQRLYIQQQTYRRIFDSPKPKAYRKFIKHSDSFRENHNEEDEQYTCGHSEQNFLLSNQWDNTVRRLLQEIANIVAKWDGESILILPRFHIDFLLNRSPCSSCARYLIIELTNFWSLLANHLYLDLDGTACQDLFKSVFSFTIVYTSLYKIREDYPTGAIMRALEQAGWRVVEHLGRSDRNSSGACVDSAVTNRRGALPLSNAEIKELRRKVKKRKREEEAKEDYHEPVPMDLGQRPPSTRARREPNRYEPPDDTKHRDKRQKR